MIGQINSRYVTSRPYKLFSRMISYFLFEGRPLTTRGRWFNRIVFLFFTLIDFLPFRSKLDDPIYILGIGRSGTTILGILLSMHKDIGYLNEPKALWHFVYQNQDLNGNYTDQPARYLWTASDYSEAHGEKLKKMYSVFKLLTASARVVDKYPELIFRTDLISHIFEQAKFVFLVRDGRSVCSSIDKWSGKFEVASDAKVDNWWGRNDKKWNYIIEQLVPRNEDLKRLSPSIAKLSEHLDRACVEWIVTMREGLKIVGEDRLDVISIRYESLCANPAIELAKLAKFLDIAEDQTFLQYGIESLTVSPTPTHINIHPILREPFDRTMRELGYFY